MNNKCVLIVEDEDTISSLLSRALQRENSPDCRIITAANGNTAVIQLTQHQFDLIILDYNVPGVNGLDLALLARKTAPYAKILLMTGHDVFDVAYNDSSIQFDGYLQKPFTLTQFLSTVNYVVN